MLMPLVAGSAAAKPKKPRDAREAAVLAAPDTRATRTVTNFADALTCMDGLLLQYGKKDIVIITDGIPDATETFKVGTREMVISALDTMSLRSGAFRFVDADFGDQNIAAMQRQMNGRSQGADYYIKGSISQVDQQVMVDGKRAGLAISEFSIGRSKDRMVSNVSLELGIYNVRDRTLIRGVRTQNTIQVIRSGTGTDVEGLLPFASLVYEVRQDRAQGTHQTIRTLVELSLIELVGKFTKVPYWRCLSLPSTDPTARRVALEYFNAMPVADRVIAAQAALKTPVGDRPGLYAGSIDGLPSPALSQAIMRYRVERNLAPGTDIDFELYFSFLSSDLATAADVPTARRPPPDLTPEPIDALDFTLEVAPTVQRGQTVRVVLQPSKDAYFYCYMGGAKEQTAIRIFPNRFDSGQTAANAVRRIPADEQQFSIRLDKVGQEQIACIARLTPYEGKLPPSVITPDLQAPIPSPLPSLTGIQAVINEHQKFDTQGFNSVVRVATVEVTY